MPDATKGLRLIFDKEISADDRESALLSTWAAEQSATHSYGRVLQHPNEWARTFRDVMGRIGWVTTTAGTRWVVLEPGVAALADVLNEFLREVLGPSAPTEHLVGEFTDGVHTPFASFFGWMGYEGGQPVMHTALLVVSDGPPPQASQAPKLATSIEMECWDAVLSESVFKVVRPKLQELYDSRH